jgi:hypothetical protein
MACECKNNPNGDLCYCDKAENKGKARCGGNDDERPCTATNTCPDQTYTEGSLITDSACGNQYVCTNAEICNQEGTRNNPANYPNGWLLNECGYFNEKPNPPAVDYAESGSKVLMQTCNKYICSDNGNGQSNKCSKNAPSGLGNGNWTQCYSGKCNNPAAPPSPYKSGDIIYNKDCTKKYKCLNAKECNSENKIAPGDDSTVWSLTNQ